MTEFITANMAPLMFAALVMFVAVMAFGLLRKLPHHLPALVGAQVDGDRRPGLAVVLGPEEVVAVVVARVIVDGDVRPPARRVGRRRQPVPRRLVRRPGARGGPRAREAARAGRSA